LNRGAQKLLVELLVAFMQDCWG